MPDHRILPDVRAIIASILKRIDALERRLGQIRTSRREQEFVFSLAGSVAVSTSGRGYLRFSARASEVLVSFTEGGDAISIIGIYRNNILMESVSMAVDQTFQKVPLSSTFAADQDFVTVGVIQAGVGAMNLVAQVRFE